MTLPQPQTWMLTNDSPLGKFGPGAVEINEVFNDMWREAENNRSKWGCKSWHMPKWVDRQQVNRTCH